MHLHVSTGCVQPLAEAWAGSGCAGTMLSHSQLLRPDCMPCLAARAPLGDIGNVERQFNAGVNLGKDAGAAKKPCLERVRLQTSFRSSCLRSPSGVPAAATAKTRSSLAI